MTEVTTSKGEKNGMSAIVQVVIDNPMASVQLFGGIFVAAGLYYGMSTSITELKAQAVHDHVDTLTAVTDMRTTQAASANQFKLDLADTNARVAQLDARGSLRYGEIKDSLSAVGLKVTRVDTNVEWLIRQIEEGAVGNGYAGDKRPFPRRGSPLSPVPPAPAGGDTDVLPNKVPVDP